MSGDKKCCFFKRNKFIDCTGSLFALSLSFSVIDLALANEVEIEEVMVTAQKREQSVFDVPISISVLNSEELANAGIQDLADLAYAVPELAVLTTDPGMSFSFIRGIANFSGSASLVGIYIDESAVSTEPLFEVNPRALDLERVEVLRGPQGTLFGQGSMGGTIRFITKAPELDRFSVRGDASLSSTEDSDELNQRYSGVINVPVVEDVFALRIAGEFENLGGWVDHPVAGREDVNDQKFTNLHIKGLWDVSDAFEIKGKVIISKVDAESGNRNVDENRNFKGFVFPTALHPAELRDELYALSASYDFGPVRLLGSSSYFKHEWEGDVSVDFPPYESFAHSLLDYKVFTQELRLDSTGEGPLTWTVGGFYRDFEANRPFTSFISLGGVVFPPSSGGDTRENDSWAVFGDVAYAMTDRLEVGAGLRYFEEDKTQSSIPLTIPRTATFDAVTWRTYLTYDVTRDITVYANVATGFRSGGFGPATSARPTYDPDEVISYEVGTKTSWLDGQLAAELSLFYSEYQNFQGNEFDPFGPNPVTNVGDAEIKGVGFDLVWHPTDALTLAVNGNVVDAEITKLNGISTKIVGDPVDYTPDYSYSISAHYTFNWNDSVPGFARVDYNEQAEMSYINRSLTNPTTGFFGESDTLQFLNTRVGAEWNKWTAEIYAKNLLDEDGEVSAIGDSAFDFPARARPRTIGIKIGLDL